MFPPLYKRKTPYELRYFNFDFSNRLPSGVIINQLDSLTSERKDGRPSDLSIDNLVVDVTGRIVQCRIGNGSLSRDYKLSVKVILSDNQKKEAIRYLRVTE